jgi:ABC-type nitrate/sulfonate/bicarbonate transport system permease component
MTAVNEVQATTGAAKPAAAVPDQTPFWHRQAVYRYGFLAVILIVWELVGPTINPIFFTYPSRIVIAFYGLLMSG